MNKSEKKVEESLDLTTLYYIRTQLLTYTYPTRKSRCNANLSCLDEYEEGIRHTIEVLDKIIREKEKIADE